MPSFHDICRSKGDTFALLKAWKPSPNVSCVAGKAFESRAASTSRLLDAAMSNIPYAFEKVTAHAGDGFLSCNNTELTYANKWKKNCSAHLIPDFVFGGWPETGFSDFSLLTHSLANISATRAAHQICGWATSLNFPLRKEAASLMMVRRRQDGVPSPRDGNTNSCDTQCATSSALCPGATARVVM